MALVVTGLSQDGDIHALHQALADAGLPTDALQVIGPDESTQGVSRGLAGSEPAGRRRDHADHRGRTPTENYVEALERGRSVVAFFAHPDNVDKVEEIFRGANLSNVKRF